MPPSSTLKMEDVCSSETLVYNQKTTQHNNKDHYHHHLHSYSSENLKSYKDTQFLGAINFG